MLLNTHTYHHATTDCINGVGSETGSNSDNVTDNESSSDTRVGRKERHDRIVETKVETTVDEDTDKGDVETTVETLDTIALEGLLVNIEESIELTLAIALGGLEIIGKTSTGVVERVHEGKGTSTSKTATGNVLGKLQGIGIILCNLEGGDGLNLALEGKVESLGGEVSEAVGEVGSPEGSKTLVSHDPASAIHNASKRLGKGSTLDHLILVLHHLYAQAHQESHKPEEEGVRERPDARASHTSVPKEEPKSTDHLNTLDGSSNRLGDNGSGTGEHEVLGEVELHLSALGLGTKSHVGPAKRIKHRGLTLENNRTTSSQTSCQDIPLGKHHCR